MIPTKHTMIKMSDSEFARVRVFTITLTRAQIPKGSRVKIQAPDVKIQFTRRDWLVWMAVSILDCMKINEPIVTLHC